MLHHIALKIFYYAIKNYKIFIVRGRFILCGRERKDDRRTLICLRKVLLLPGSSVGKPPEETPPLRTEMTRP